MEYDFDTKKALMLGSLNLLKKHKKVDDGFTLNVFSGDGTNVNVIAYSQNFEPNHIRMNARMKEWAFTDAWFQSAEKLWIDAHIGDRGKKLPGSQKIMARLSTYLYYAWVGAGDFDKGLRMKR